MKIKSKSKSKPDTVENFHGDVVIVNCKVCSGSGDERYVTGGDQYGRQYFSDRTCTGCAGIGRVKYKLSDIREGPCL